MQSFFYPRLGVLLLGLGLLLGGSYALAFSFDDIERLEQVEQQELLKLVKQAARRNNFRQARDYLSRARNASYNPTAVAEAERIIAQAEEAERRRIAEERRLAEERRRQQAARQSASSGSRASSQGERQLNCRIVCRTSGFLMYDTRVIEQATIRAWPGSETRRMTELCRSTFGGGWYHSSDNCR